MIENAAEKDIVCATLNMLYTYRNNRVPGGTAGSVIGRHQEFEINYILRGRLLILCGEEQIHAEKGDLVILCPNTPYGVFPDGKEGCEYDTLSFTPGLLRESGRSEEYIEQLMNGSKVLRPHIAATATQSSLVKSTIENIFSCVKEVTERKDMLLKNDMLLKSEMFCLFSLLEQEGAIYTNTDSTNGHDLRPALDYISSHYYEQILISHLASLVNLSKNYFMSRFRQVTGITCVEYINKVRINAACQMLLCGKMSVTEVAFSCGYGNLSNFNRQFRRITGRSPREYREKNIGPPHDSVLC